MGQNKPEIDFSQKLTIEVTLKEFSEVVFDTYNDGFYKGKTHAGEMVMSDIVDAQLNALWQALKKLAIPLPNQDEKN